MCCHFSFVRFHPSLVNTIGLIRICISNNGGYVYLSIWDCYRHTHTYMYGYVWVYVYRQTDRLINREREKMCPGSLASSSFCKKRAIAVSMLGFHTVCFCEVRSHSVIIKLFKWNYPSCPIFLLLLLLLLFISSSSHLSVAYMVYSTKDTTGQIVR